MRKVDLHRSGGKIGRTGSADSFNVSLTASYIRKKDSFLLSFFLMKLALSETLKLSTKPVLPIRTYIGERSRVSEMCH